MFICISGNYCGTGLTLEAAHQEWKDYSGSDDNAEECDFYELPEKLEIEVKIVKKQVIKKVK